MASSSAGAVMVRFLALAGMLPPRRAERKTPSDVFVVEADPPYNVKIERIAAEPAGAFQ